MAKSSDMALTLVALHHSTTALAGIPAAANALWEPIVNYFRSFPEAVEDQERAEVPKAKLL